MTYKSSRSPVLLEIPHFASNAGAERETVVLRSSDGETWTLHVSDTVHDGEIYQVCILLVNIYIKEGIYFFEISLFTFSFVLSCVEFIFEDIFDTVFKKLDLSF